MSVRAYPFVLGLMIFLLEASGGNTAEATAMKAQPSSNKKTTRVVEKTEPKRRRLIESAPLHIEELYDRLMKRRKSKAAEYVRRAYEALAEKKFQAVRNYARKLKSDYQYSDFSEILMAKARLGEGEAHLKLRNFPLTVSSGASAKNYLITLEKDRPDSIFGEAVHILLAQADLTIARGYFGQKKRKSSKWFFEKAFERLNDRELRLNIDANSLKVYSAACAKAASNDICRYWAKKLFRLYPKNSREVAAMASFLPFLSQMDVPDFPHVRVYDSYRVSDEKDAQELDRILKLTLAGKYLAAVEGFDQFYLDFPRSKHIHRARYWQARSYLKTKYREEAFDLFEQVIQQSPLSYYGMLAAVETEKDIGVYLNAELPLGRTRDDQLWPLDFKRIRRAEDLLFVGAPEIAAQEIRSVQPRSELSNEFLAYLASLKHEAGDHLGAFIAVEELLDRGYPGIFSSFGLRLIFPFYRGSEIEKAATVNELDPLLVFSLIKQESAFREDAVSSSNAYGLMQVVHPTALDMNPGIEVSEMVQPEQSLQLGTKYLAHVIRKFDGNVALALSGYNAGPHRTLQWVKNIGEDWGVQEFVESIPYPETRGYVAGIIRNYYWYTYRSTGKRLENLSFFWKNSPN